MYHIHQSSGIQTICFRIHHREHWNGQVLLEKPTVAPILKNFPTYHGTRRFMTVFTRAHTGPHPESRWIQSRPPHPISLKYIGPFLLAFPPTPCMQSFSPHTCYMPCLSHPPSLDHSNYIWQRVHIMYLIMQFSPTSYYYLIHLTIPIFSSAPFSQTLSVHVLPLISKTKFHTHSKLHAKLWFYTF